MTKEELLKLQFDDVIFHQSCGRCEVIRISPDEEFMLLMCNDINSVIEKIFKINTHICIVVNLDQAHLFSKIDNHLRINVCEFKVPKNEGFYDRSGKKNMD